MHIDSYIGFVLSLLIAPILPGIINKTKALFAGRRGPPLLQGYFDLWKLFRQKSAVYSRTTTWIFRAAPSVFLVSILLAMLIMPFAGISTPLSFSGDFLFFVYLFGLARFFIVVAALDTGSSFEGMGASREVKFSALAEPAFIIGIVTLALISKSLSLSSMLTYIDPTNWQPFGPALVLLGVAFFIILLSENSRMPFDDPNTHLELTMIHEVMILDYSGPDLGLMLYASSLKLWVMGALIVNTFLPMVGLKGVANIAAFLVGMVILAMLIGIVESIMARLKLFKIPEVLLGAAVLSILAFTLVMRLK